MKPRYLSSLAAVGFGALFFGPSPALAQPYLGPTLSPFAVLAGSTVTCTGPGTITGNVGLQPGTSVTGFPPCLITPPGALHVADAVALQAQTELTTAFTDLGPVLPCTQDLTGTNLGGLTLTPGVYCFSTSAQLTGVLTLDSLGNPNASWVFRTGSTLTTASGSSVVFTGGNPCAAQWRIGSSATLGTTTAFQGNILAQDSITLNTGASLVGRALARTGAVTLDGNNITNLSACAAAPAPPPFPGPAPVPTLPQIGAWLLLLVLLGIGAYALSRRTPTEASR